MQFIPRLSSTSINNKHLHKTRAGLRGLRRHRPARSTLDETPCLLGPYWAPRLLSTRLVFSRWDPQAQSLLMPSPTYQSCFLSSLTETPQCLRWWQRAPVAHDKRQTLWRFLCVPSFSPSASLLSFDWCVVQHLWRDLVLGWGQKGAWERGEKCLLTCSYRVWFLTNAFRAVHSVWASHLGQMLFIVATFSSKCGTYLNRI